jgi:hypothetical protein
MPKLSKRALDDIRVREQVAVVVGFRRLFFHLFLFVIGAGRPAPPLLHCKSELQAAAET